MALITMHILHATWVPLAEKPSSDSRYNEARLHIWVETVESGKAVGAAHPAHLSGKGLREFFGSTLGLGKEWTGFLDSQSPLFLTLPSVTEGPLPSLELLSYLGEELPEGFFWKSWELASLVSDSPMALLKELHFAAQSARELLMLGSDFLFWHGFSRQLAEWLRQHRYGPALAVHPGKGRGRAKGLEYSPLWRPLSEEYEATLTEWAGAMPAVCVAGGAAALRPKSKQQPRLREPLPLLRHFSEQVVSDLVMQTRFTQKALKAVEGTLIEPAADPLRSHTEIDDERARQWARWYHQLNQSQRESRLVLGFRLHEAEPEQPDHWRLNWLLCTQDDEYPPLALAEYWDLGGAKQKPLTRRFGAKLEEELLLQIGQAARIYPELWQGLDSARPTGIVLSRAEALDFLREQAWLLEESGYRVIVPAWWSASGRRRARLRLRASGKSSGAVASSSKGFFNLPELVRFEYQLAVGDELVSPEEWQALMASGESLVNFRGQWVELDRQQMEQNLALLEQSGAETDLQVAELLRREAEGEEAGFELVYDDALNQMMKQLRDPDALQVAEAPTDFQGQLRPYQQRGLAWMDYLERLGMGPCLADDMGLGKTVQVIALLLRERERADATRLPTLLIAPTSVLGNWQHELRRFAPQLRSQIHHGAKRVKEAKAFAEQVRQQDVLITSFALLRLDDKLFHKQQWQRVVVDEAQNLKNPKSAQTKAILKLNARRRLALTGTPIENRLLDLWSIFHFLNPGYLGTSTQFRNRFEKPIQRDDDRQRAKLLRQLVEPYILRRLKSDKAIIQDLPDKLEQKTYCNLSPEQATLYQGVVDQVEKELEEAEGIQRKGLMLATLMKLKQICNHPAQFLQDQSAFTPSRSHKLERVSEMVEEVMAEGESLLIFTQFTETGSALERHFRHHCRYPTHYLHGGTSRKQRERMISEFQDPATPPGVFILSLKAGGVGITLTAANHVFHFDRWWNPAVENQATDRAYRIGQEKQVFVHKMVTLGTLEERIDQMLEEKQRLAESIVGNDESWLTELDNDAFRALIHLNRSQAVMD
jgi:SNF2 family DNA or RNA helicase